MLKKVPHTFTIIAFLIILCAVISWFLPAGEYSRTTVEVNGIERTIIEDNSYHSVEPSPQTWQVFSSLLTGFQMQAGIIGFLLIIGGAFQILNSSKSIDVGIISFLKKISGLEKYGLIRRIGVNNVVMALIIIMFSLFGSVFGMSEETIAFIIIIVPLAISMGYDSLTGICLVYVASHIGFAGSVLNPFTIGIAQGLSNLPLFSGFEYRIVCWIIFTALFIVCVLFYASKVKKNLEISPMYEADEYWRKREVEASEFVQEYKTPVSTWIVYSLVLAALTAFSIYAPQSTFFLGSASITLYMVPVCTALFAVVGFIGARKSYHFFILSLLAFTVVFLIIGVMGHGWYLTEISGIFLAMGVLSGYANGESPNNIINQFLAGAKDMLSPAIIVGLSGGIIWILQEGKMIDPILHGLASLMDGAGRMVALSTMYLIQTSINIIIPSASAKAALTMPIMAPFSDVIGLSRQATVMAYQFGDGFTNMITPTSGVLMGALGIARIPYAVWVKWFYKLVILFIIIGFFLLIPTVYCDLNGF
jgi:uncharacterized ion transporter superfamily protein YfcC